MENQVFFKQTKLTSNGTEQTTYQPIYPQASIAEAVTTSDVTILTPSALFVGTGGDVTVTMADSGSSIVFKNVQSGTFMPILVTQVKAATVASDIVALR